MDTYVSITVYTADPDSGSQAIDAAFNTIGDIINVASRFDPDAECALLNSQGYIENPSSSLIEMITLSIEYNNLTNGAFDITILPLLDLWSEPLILFTTTAETSDLDAGIFPQSLLNAFSNYSLDLYELVEEPTVTPSDDGWVVQSSWQKYYIAASEGELAVSTNFWFLPSNTQDYHINQTKQFTGSDKITLSENNISLAQGSSITLDGVAKGYAVDKALQALEEHGINYALINAGGDIATLGSKPNSSGWTTALVNPQNRSQYLTTFELSDISIATSGNYERYFDENADVGHILDPRNGRTAAVASSSTILAESCTIADILATACFVLGPEEGIALAEDFDNVEAMILGFEDPTEISKTSGLGSVGVI